MISDMPLTDSQGRTVNVHDVWEHAQLTSDTDIVKAINDGKADSYARNIELTIQGEIDRREKLLRAIRERKIESKHMSMMEHYIEFENNEHEYLYNAAEGRIVRAV